MPHATAIVGDVEISALLDIELDEEPIVDAFPGVPADALLAEKSRYPSVYGDGDSWHLRVRAWLVRHPAGVLLLDTGIGPGTSPAMQWSPKPGALPETLAEIGATPEDVEIVVLSHTHDDHVGGVLSKDGNPAFPRARYILQRADRDWERSAAERSDEEGPIWTMLLAPLEDAGVLELIDGDRRLTDRLSLRHAPGHTPGHQVLWVESHGRRALLSADTWNHPMQLAHPEWPSGADDDGVRSAEMRRTLLAELLAYPGTVVAPTHFGEAFGRVAPDLDGLPAWHPTPVTS